MEDEAIVLPFSIWLLMLALAMITAVILIGGAYFGAYDVAASAATQAAARGGYTQFVDNFVRSRTQGNAEVRYSAISTNAASGVSTGDPVTVTLSGQISPLHLGPPIHFAVTGRAVADPAPPNEQFVQPSQPS